MRDVPEGLARVRRRIRRVFGETCSLFGYREVELPVIERGTLYEGTLGRSSDVVMREMFRVGAGSGAREAEDVLRPEGTAGVARMMREEGFCGSPNRRVWYEGPMFRYERPQRARYRQFTQVGVECLGKRSVFGDAEVILLARNFLRELQPGVFPKLLINTLGDVEKREEYCRLLKQFLEPRLDSLSGYSRTRYSRGAFLRVLDSKATEDREVMQKAPMLMQILSQDQIREFELLKSLLDDAEIEYEEDPYLMRGLDYYEGVAFEFVDDEGRAVLGGGGYENLLGVTGVGWAAGVERLEQYVERSESVKECSAYGADVAVIVVGQQEEEESGELDEVRRYALGVTRMARALGWSTIGELDGRNLPKTLGRAADGGAKWAIMLGTSELRGKKISVKDLGRGVQVKTMVERLVEVLGHKDQEVKSSADPNESMIGYGTKL